MRWPRFHTLRARLTAGLLVLLAVGCAAVGGAAVWELNGFLTDRLDQQLADAGNAFPASLEHPGGARDDHDGDERGDTRRQASGTLGARIVGGEVTNAAVVRPGGSVGGVVGVRVDGGDARALAAVPRDGHGHGVDLSGLGDYRVMAWPGRDGDTLITGLPLEPVEAAVHRLEIVAGGVFGLALAGAGSPVPCGCGGPCGPSAISPTPRRRSVACPWRTGRWRCPRVSLTPAPAVRRWSRSPGRSTGCWVMWSGH